VVNDIDAVLDALGDAVRRRVVEALRDGPQPAGDLAAFVGLSPSAMTRHLRMLLERGVVEDGRDPADARRRLFRLRQEPFLALREWLDQTEGGWSEHFGAFRAHVEPRGGSKQA
jgi:DNA-binding transcriptional ArsR family regulator